MLVINCIGITVNQPSGSSWLEAYSTLTDKKYEYCRNKHCNKQPKVGALVRMYKSTNHQFIVPLCNSCNKLTETITLRPDTVLMRVTAITVN